MSALRERQCPQGGPSGARDTPRGRLTPGCCGRLAAAAERPCVGPREAGAQETRGIRDSMEFMRLVEARYEKGLLKPTEPLALRPGERVNLIVVRQADPSRWNLDRLANSGTTEELALAEQGLSDWAAKLDQEDNR